MKLKSTKFSLVISIWRPLDYYLDSRLFESFSWTISAAFVVASMLVILVCSMLQTGPPDIKLMLSIMWFTAHVITNTNAGYLATIRYVLCWHVLCIIMRTMLQNAGRSKLIINRRRLKKVAPEIPGAIWLGEWVIIYVLKYHDSVGWPPPP